MEQDSSKLYWPINKLKNWDKNPRSINKADFARLKKQIESLGEYKPLLIIDDGTVLGGNMRLRAYKELGWQKVWVSIVEAETEQEKLEYALSDNDRAGEYDEQALAELILESPNLDLTAYHVDLGITQGLQVVVSKFAPDPEEDELPSIEENPISKLGEIYQLGKHRVMCGDSTDKKNIEQLMSGKKVDMVFTDPPYGMGLNTDWSGIKGSSKAFAKVAGGNYDAVIGDNDDFTPELITSIFNNFGYCKEIFLFGADYYAELLSEKNEGSWCVWDKRKPSQEDAIGAEFELIWSKQKHKRRVLRHDWFGFLSSKNTQDARNRVHPTQKPITLLIDIMKQWGKDEDVVIDPFLGSGSTLIACEQTDRICYGMEIDPKYCDVIRKRYANLIDKGDEWQKITLAIKA